jgi:hypothetical protein
MLPCLSSTIQRYFSAVRALLVTLKVKLRVWNIMVGRNTMAGNGALHS